MDTQHIEVIVTAAIIAVAVCGGVTVAVLSLVFANDLKKFIRNEYE